MSHLSDAGRALEIVDAQLIAIQVRLKERRDDDADDIVDQLDLVIADIRGAAVDITKHACRDHDS